MQIPKHDEIRIPALKLLQERGILKISEFEKPIAEIFHLSDEELTQMYESGNGPVFYDRITWALSYLSMAGLVNKPKRGVYEISEQGIKILETPDQVNTYIQKEIEKREPVRKTKKERDILDLETADLTPQEKLYVSFGSIRKSIYNEIIETILSKTPREFEKLVVALLQKMGYGGEISDSGIVTKASNDQGIDGIIKEDVLGLGRINIQAKRYARNNTVKRDEIQKFVGALQVAQSNKGVFITTSSYSQGAIKYVNDLVGSSTLVLIDGEQLAEYIYDYSLGMQTEQTIEIKKLDSDYWDSMQDDAK
jgi:restriction system protein